MLFKVNDRLGWLVQLLVKEYIKVPLWVLKEVLDKTAVEEVAVDVELLVPIDHVLVLKRVRRVPHSAVLCFRRLIPLARPLGLSKFGLCLARQGRHWLRVSL